MNAEALKAWIERELKNGQFRSLNQWALKAGLNVSTLNGVRMTGRGDPETLIKIGAAAGRDPQEMFELVGWFKPRQGTITPSQQALLNKIDELEPAARRFLFRGLGLEGD